jgi:hypothetical protein
VCLYDGNDVGDIFMQYWLIDYAATCPSGWITSGTGCYTNSNATAIPALTASELSSVQFSGTAASGGNDAVSLSLVGLATETTVTNSDSMLDLAAHWNTTEWGVYGDGDGYEAYFGANTSLEHGPCAVLGL